MLMATNRIPKPPPDSDFFKQIKTLVPNLDFNRGINVQVAENIPDPRTIKCHLPFSLMPKNLLDTAKVFSLIFIFTQHELTSILYF